MSRMTKFLKQTCKFKAVVRDADGNAVLDMYGAPQYTDERTLKCRRENRTENVLSAVGAVIRVSTVYYLDEAVEINQEDMLDGHPVLFISEYTNEHGLREGFECRV